VWVERGDKYVEFSAMAKSTNGRPVLDVLFQYQPTLPEIIQPNQIRERSLVNRHHDTGRPLGQLFGNPPDGKINASAFNPLNEL
jgi:hypothetical protein